MKIVEKSWYIRGISDALDGDAKQKKFSKKLESELNMKIEKFVTCEQVHSSEVAVLCGARAERKDYFSKTDGLITDLPGVVLGIFTADCVPVTVIEDERKIIGVIHAGWRGTAKGILKKALELLKEKWGAVPAQLKFFLGPHIRSCCYEVGKDVAVQFPEKCITRIQEQLFLNLESAIRLQLWEEGACGEKISVDLACTCCNTNFFSYRRDKTEKRMLSFIAKLN